MQDGFINLCKKYGPVKNITIHKTIHENQAFIQFEDNELVILHFINETCTWSFLTCNHRDSSVILKFYAFVISVESRKYIWGEGLTFFLLVNCDIVSRYWLYGIKTLI